MTRAGPATAGVAAAVLVALSAAGCGSAPDATGSGSDQGPAVVLESGSADDGPYAGTEIDPPFALPRVTLTRDDDSQLQLASDLDRPVRLFFYGYTRCPDICSLVMSDLALAVSRLPADVADAVQVVFVTSDPARDTPAALRAYLDRFDPDFTGLTGDLATISRVAAAMGVAIEEGPRLPSGGYEVRHSDQVIGYTGVDGVVAWSQGTPVDDLAADLARLVAAAGSGTTG